MHSKSNVLIKTSRFLFSTVRLKSLINIILSYLLVCLFKISDKLSRKYLSFCDGGYRGQYRIIFKFLWKIQSKLFRSHQRLLQGSQLYDDIFIGIKNDSTTVFASIPLIQLVAIDLKLVVRKYSI